MMVNVPGPTEAWSWEGSPLTYRQLQMLSLDARGGIEPRQRPASGPGAPGEGEQEAGL